MASSRSTPTKPRQKSVKGQNMVGSKWVGPNWEAIVEATEANGGETPDSISLVTSAYPNKGVWSEENLPTILFYLIPPPSRHQGTPVRKKTRDDDGKEIRQFEILPDRIGIDVKGWLIEAWRRLDSRITYDDIRDRMTADPLFCNGKGLVLPSRNSLQMETHRSCRKLLGSWPVYGRRDEPHRTMVEALEKLSSDNILYNTVLSRSSWAPDRLVKVKFERKSEDGQYRPIPMEVTPENFNVTTFPITHFCQQLPNGVGSFDDCMDKTFELLLILQERAEIHGVADWTKLHKKCRPMTWEDRTPGAAPANRNQDDQDGDDRAQLRVDTYDGGCAICTHNEARDYGLDYAIPQDLSVHEPPSRKRPDAMKSTSAERVPKMCSQTTSSSKEQVHKRRREQAEELYPSERRAKRQHATHLQDDGEDAESGISGDARQELYSTIFASPRRYGEAGPYLPTSSPLQQEIGYQRFDDMTSSPPAYAPPPSNTIPAVKSSGTLGLIANQLKEQPKGFMISCNRDGFTQLPAVAHPSGYRTQATFDPELFQPDLQELHHPAIKSEAISFTQCPVWPSDTVRTVERSKYDPSRILPGNAFYHSLATGPGYAETREPTCLGIGSPVRNIHDSPFTDVQQRTFDLQRVLFGAYDLPNQYDPQQPTNIQSDDSWGVFNAINTPTIASDMLPRCGDAEAAEATETGFKYFKKLGNTQVMINPPATPPLLASELQHDGLSFDDFTHNSAFTPPEDFSDAFFGGMLNSDEFCQLSPNTYGDLTRALDSPCAGKGAARWSQFVDTKHQLHEAPQNDAGQPLRRL